jgi:hypothetical protein
MRPELFKYAKIYGDLADEQGLPVGKNILAPFLARFFNALLKGGKTLPSNWLEMVVTPIYKGKGDKLLPDNYRGLSLCPALCKLYTLMISNRLIAYLESSGRRHDAQFGFRPKKGILHNMFILKHVRSLVCSPLRMGGMGLPLYACLIDFKKAFDSAARELIWRSLEGHRINDNVARAVKDLYTGLAFRVRVNGVLGATIVASISGVKQGCPLSPTLFGLFVEQLHAVLQQSHPNEGVILERVSIMDTMFADDVLFLSTTVDGLQHLLDGLEVFERAYGLQVNPGKTELFVFEHVAIHASNGRVVAEPTTSSLEEPPVITYRGGQVRVEGGDKVPWCLD